MADTGEIVRFADFELDTADRQLRRGGSPVDLGSRYFDALALMVGEAGSLIAKDRFMDEVWRGIPVTDEALTQCIRTLRRALGDDAAAPRFIQTVPKHGYRFIADIEGRQDPGGGRAPTMGLPGAVAGSATLAGGAVGALGGLFYGIVASTGGAPTVLALTALVAALGVLAGAGVGLGMASALAWRGRPDAVLVLGASLGGMAVGALGGTLARDGIDLVTGMQLGPVTGLFEGVVLGAAAGGAGWLVLRRDGMVATLVAAAVFGGLAGLFIHATGGRLLGGTLNTLQRELGGARLALENIGAITAEQGFGRTANLVTTFGEAALFTFAIAAGLLAVRRRD